MKVGKNFNKFRYSGSLYIRDKEGVYHPVKIKSFTNSAPNVHLFTNNAHKEIEI